MCESGLSPLLRQTDPYRGPCIVSNIPLPKHVASNCGRSMAPERFATSQELFTIAILATCFLPGIGLPGPWK